MNITEEKDFTLDLVKGRFVHTGKQVKGIKSDHPLVRGGFVIQIKTPEEIEEARALGLWDFGVFNGYIVLSPEHPFAKIEKTKEDSRTWLINQKIHELIPPSKIPTPHGGVTYAEFGWAYKEVSPFPEILEKFGWSENHFIIGFDMPHAGDTIEYWTKERTFEELIRSLEIISQIKFK